MFHIFKLSRRLARLRASTVLVASPLALALAAACTADPTNETSLQPSGPIPETVASELTNPLASAVTAGSCMSQTGPLVTLRGAQQRYDNRKSMPSNSKIDARQASWTGIVDFPVVVGNQNAPGMCWSGGTIRGIWPLSSSWTVFHSTGGLLIFGPNAIVEDVAISNYGDGIRIQDYGSHWTLRRIYMQAAHDDCIENDRQHSGVVEDALFEGCYIFLSERPGSKTLRRNSSRDTVAIRNSLIWLKPMPSVYRGPAPGTGPLWKWDDAGTGSKLVISNTVFRVDQRPSHGQLDLPPGLVGCANNTIVWLGGGPFPSAYPSCFKVTTDRTVWDRAASDWKARHP